MTPFMSPALEDEARAKARRSTTQDHTHACSGANAMRQPDCEEKRDPDLAKNRIKDENMELDPKARLEKQSLASTLVPFCLVPEFEAKGTFQTNRRTHVSG